MKSVPSITHVTGQITFEHVYNFANHIPLNASTCRIQNLTSSKNSLDTYEPVRPRTSHLNTQIPLSRENPSDTAHGQSERNHETCDSVLRPKLLHWENQTRDHSKLLWLSESFSLVQ